MERGYFVNGAFEINAKCEETAIGFQKLMFNKMRLPNMNNIQDFSDIMRKKKMVLIIYNIDKILQKDKSEFLNTICQIHDGTENIKAIFIVEKVEDLDCN